MTRADSGLGFSLELFVDWSIQPNLGGSGIWAGKDPQGDFYIEIARQPEAALADDSAFPLSIIAGASSPRPRAGTARSGATDSCSTSSGEARLRTEDSTPRRSCRSRRSSPRSASTDGRLAKREMGSPRWILLRRTPPRGSLRDPNLVIAGWVGDGFVLIDSPDRCGGEQNVSTNDEGWPVLECPDGSTVSYGEDGMPFKTNPAEFQESVEVYETMRRPRRARPRGPALSLISPLPPGRRPGALPAPGRRAPRSRGSSCS